MVISWDNVPLRVSRIGVYAWVLSTIQQWNGKPETP